MLPYNPPTNPFLDIIYVDSALVVANKPSGLLTVPGRGEDKSDCLITRIKTVFPSTDIVHRLDMQTSGLVVLSRTRSAQRKLARSFQERQVDKNYQAWVAGCPDAESGEINLPLMPDWPNRPRQKVDMDEGKTACTRWQVLDRREDRCLLSLTPITGRTHQLRLHLAEIGHPILGDPLYAPPEVTNMAPRLYLHACNLSFEHPQTKKQTCFTSQTPF